jgi:hypothetical protein
MCRTEYNIHHTTPLPPPHENTHIHHTGWSDMIEGNDSVISDLIESTDNWDAVTCGSCRLLHNVVPAQAADPMTDEEIDELLAEQDRELLIEFAGHIDDNFDVPELIDSDDIVDKFLEERDDDAIQADEQG